jgi:large subunit ribosomal protein L10
MSTEVRHASKVPEWKKSEVKDLADKIEKTRVVAVIGIREIPASDLQRIRGELRAVADIKVVRNNIAKRAIGASVPEIGPLSDYIEDQSALLFSNTNPFQLKKLLDAGKKPMPAKAGMKAPKEIAVDAGETSFSPGPMVGKLQSAGIPAAIKSGKVVINQRTVLAKEGDIISSKLAEVLQIMEIYPRDVGLEIRAAYEGGLVFHAKDLSIDVDSVAANMVSAKQKAFGLAVEIGYATAQTVGPMLQRASMKAKALVATAALPIPGSMDIVICKAAANAAAIASLVEGDKAPAASSPKAAEAPKAEVEEEKKEEDTAAGLGSLFG